MDNFWNNYTLPTQDSFLDIEEINPAEAYRRQADAINLSGPIYAEIERLDARFYRISRVEKELRTRILAQNITNIKSTFRSSELLDAFIVHSAQKYVTDEGEIKDVSETVIRLGKRRQELDAKLKRLNKRIAALESMADKCDRILNWAKHQARLELGLIT